MRGTPSWVRFDSERRLRDGDVRIVSFTWVKEEGVIALVPMRGR